MHHMIQADNTVAGLTSIAHVYLSNVVVLLELVETLSVTCALQGRNCSEITVPGCVALALQQ